KVPCSKQLHNVSEMGTNLVPACNIVRVVRFRLDGASIRIEPEVMCRFLVRKPHHFIPALYHAFMMTLFRRFLLVVPWAHWAGLRRGLFLCRRGECAKDQNRHEE